MAAFKGGYDVVAIDMRQAGRGARLWGAEGMGGAKGGPFPGTVTILGLFTIPRRIVQV